ncbi:2-oxoacid:acceptor oxidoreductase subunit alpha [Marinibaculum pumilum]|uniref:2-oxoacid:acceptor oxidoreductase subunit alpha n=1 Tax=Marinibaculum pumilum TaxID=1766165 RepID=A0ABV7L356_9PROT
MSTPLLQEDQKRPSAPREERDSVVVRFAGDSGDGMQLTGSQFSQATALAGNDLATFPDFPAEIRAPVGTTYGVSAFQINFGATSIETSGDAPDVLVALNPAALAVNIKRLRKGGLVLLDSGSFTDRNLRQAGFDGDPRADGTLGGYQVLEIDISQRVLDVARPMGLSQKDALRCKNMWVLGLVYWMYDRDPQATLDWLAAKFAKLPEVAEANIAALKAGHAYGETMELSGEMRGYRVPKREVEPGTYRLITGAQALAWGLVAGCELAHLKMTFCSYPITPSSPLLHILSGLKQFGVVTFQAEDEIAAACAAIGASYAGSMGITASSGPGIALKTEAIGLAIGAELPLVVVDTQRGGPSTGLPTKTEQSDLYLAVWGRNADAPMPAIAAHGPGDCFDAAIEAVRIATKYMTPVMLLSDGYIANAAEPWLIPDMNDREPFPVSFRTDPEGFSPFHRDAETLARNWAIPGTPGLEHRIGGIERDYETGHISYDPANHQKMTNVRADKINGIAQDVPEQAFTEGGPGAALTVVGWGSTYGPIRQAVVALRNEGLDVAHVHVRYLWPLPRNLGSILEGTGKVLVPEMNTGQFATLLRSQYLVPAESLSKVTGQPFTISELKDAIRARLGAGA